MFEFSFDFNLDLARRDTNNTSIRVDISNVRGYWDAIVDSPGIQSSANKRLENRFFSPSTSDWIKKWQDFEDSVLFNPEDAIVIKEDVSAPIFWETVDDCYVDEDYYGEGVGASVRGSVDAQLWYGFTMVVSTL